MTTDHPYFFLDIDGVLNSRQRHEKMWGLDRGVLVFNKEEPNDEGIMFFNDYGGDWVEESKVSLFRDLVKKHSACVVIISAWCMTDKEAQPIADFFGFGEYLHQLNYYENFYTGRRSRGEAIHLFCQEYSIKKRVVFDDSWQKMHNGYWNFCVRIDEWAGLTEEDCEFYIPRILSAQNEKEA